MRAHPILLVLFTVGCARAGDAPPRDSARTPAAAARPDTVSLRALPAPPVDTAARPSTDDANVVVDSSSAEPRIEGVRGAHVLRLPAAMHRAVRDLLPRFRAMPRDAFGSSMAAWTWERHPETALFAVVADFDGDGRLDAAIEAIQGTVVVLNHASGPRAECIERCVDTIDVPRVGSVERYIELQARGKVHVFDEDDDHASITIARDGFQRVYFEKAAELVYYKGGKWMLVVTAD